MKKVTPVYLMNFLLAVSTTIGMTLIPLLATEKLGMSLVVLGLIEGSTELVSNILRLVTGNLFDRWSNRRFLFVLPTTLAFISKIILCLPSAIALLATKLIERISNGAFAAPRDAFIGEHAEHKGIGLGLLGITKSLGCIIGPLIISSSVLFAGSAIDNSFNFVLFACFLSFISVVCAFFVKVKKLDKNVEQKFQLAEMKIFFQPIKPILILAFIFFIGRFNDGLIMIFLKEKGFSESYYLSTISIFNASMLISSPILGFYIDIKKETTILFVTIMALIGFNILFFNIVDQESWLLASLGLIMWGIQRTGAQMTFTAMIFNKLPHVYYGTAVGVFSVLSGLSVFIASSICGHIAVKNFANVFIFSGTFAVISLLLTVIFKYKRLL